ncbi:type I restriction/modification system, S subunit [Campylobacter showae]|uniref:restriction endonuclease subunit S n=1 Tax=Campylobacter showae TaxID=204 RepID=UPI0003017C63|nr:restriction endonuclease subunit S [Campylobacter showae]QCD48402.1 type I restriction/modification system, S subunit [Campylobacter showae]
MSEFKNLPSGWKVVRLGEIGKIVNGLTYSPENVSNNGLLVLRSSNINDNSIVLNNDDVYVKGISKFNKTLENDILICVRNGSKNLIGKSALITEKYKDLAFGAFMAIFRSNYNLFLIHIFKTNTFFKQVKNDLGATINSINNGNLLNFKIPLPPLDEQKKIAEILSTWDEAINLTINLIESKKQFKKALMQNLLTAKIRFPQFKDEWKETKLGKILKEHKIKSDNKSEVFSVSVHKGIINQIEHLGRSFSAEDTSNYNLVKPFDLVYTKSPTGDFPFGIIKQNLNPFNVIVSPLYGVFEPINKFLGTLLHYFFESSIRTNNYLKPIIQKGAKNTINISNDTFLSRSILVPINLDEQQKIAEVLMACDDEINLLNLKLENLKKQKQGLMQKLLKGEIRTCYVKKAM